MNRKLADLMTTGHMVNIILLFYGFSPCIIGSYFIRWARHLISYHREDVFLFTGKINTLELL